MGDIRALKDLPILHFPASVFRYNWLGKQISLTFCRSSDIEMRGIDICASFFSSSSLPSGWAVSGPGAGGRKGPPPPASGLVCLSSEQGTSQSRADPKGLLETQDVEAESVSAFGCTQNTDGFVSTWVPSAGRLGTGIPACGEVRWHSGTSTPTWPGWRGRLRCRSVYIVFVTRAPVGADGSGLCDEWVARWTHADAVMCFRCRSWCVDAV